MIVVDASICAALVLEDETSPSEAVQARIFAGPLIAPAHWVAEVGNTLLSATRRKRMDDVGRELAIKGLHALRVDITATSPDHAWLASFDLAQQHRLTVYDAAYLQLAIKKGAALASNDSELVDAARACGVEVLTALP